MQNKPSVLMTNLSLCEYAGSELRTVEMARAFISKGWDVTCYALAASFPIQGFLQALGAKIVTFGNEQELESRYSLFYAQHWICSEYIWSTTHISFDKVVVSVLGKIPEEAPPSFTNEADMVLFVSQEAEKYWKDRIPQLEVPSFIFGNGISKQDFVHENTQNNSVMRAPFHAPSTLLKVAVISNHIPPELREFATLAETDNRFASVELFGREDEAAYINTQFLKQFDVVVSIGRTVQLCFAAGIPVFCYDHFGGLGYISTKEMFEENARTNFSGRSCPVKQSASQLADEIYTGYEQVRKNLKFLSCMCYEHYLFEDIFDEFFGELANIQNRPRAGCLPDLWGHEAALMLCKHVNVSLYRELEPYLWSGFYYSDIEEWNEKQAVHYLVKSKVVIEVTARQIGIEEKVYSTLRFDPAEIPCEVVVEVKDGQKFESNAKSVQELSKTREGISRYHFEFSTTDPQVIFYDIDMTEGFAYEVEATV